jgi:hypothetical protein
MRVCRRNLIDFYPRQRVNLRFDKIFGLGRTRTVALMLFFAEERGLRKEEDNLEEKEFVFVDVVVANIVISVFPSCCEEMLFFVQGPISVVFSLLRVLPFFPSFPAKSKQRIRGRVKKKKQKKANFYRVTLRA